jgi:hypothetical protein
MGCKSPPRRNTRSDSGRSCFSNHVPCGPDGARICEGSPCTRPEQLDCSAQAGRVAAAGAFLPVCAPRFGERGHRCSELRGIRLRSECGTANLNGRECSRSNSRSSVAQIFAQEIAKFTVGRRAAACSVRDDGGNRAAALRSRPSGFTGARRATDVRRVWNMEAWLPAGGTIGFQRADFCGW